MRRLPAVLFLLSLIPVLAIAQHITFVPQWTPQSQFAGFYAAYEKGFYAAEGLDVEIRHVKYDGSESPLGLLLSGVGDIAGLQTIQSIVARSQGSPIVNVMQVTQSTGLYCVTRNPVQTVRDLDGKSIGKWKSGYSEICEMITHRDSISVNWVPFTNGVNLFAYGALDAILCYSYSEYARLLLTLGHIDGNNVLKFSEMGFRWPEDGIYVTEKYYNENRELIGRFLKATRSGWDWVRENRMEAVRISMKYAADSHVRTNQTLETYMLDEYLSLQQNTVTGVADYAPISEPVFNAIRDELYDLNFIDRKVEYNEIIK